VTRPISIVWYEWLAVAGVAAALASAAADRATLAKYYSQHPIFYPILIACVFAVQLLWIWLIARKRQNWARWISLVVMVLGIPFEILGFDERMRFNASSAIASYVAFVMWLIAVLLLFRRDARAWFAGQRLASEASRPS
jgi:glucan phosphoethanolaminetransferase (alkaline phosphatase superfamily)